MINQLFESCLKNINQQPYNSKTQSLQKSLYFYALFCHPPCLISTPPKKWTRPKSQFFVVSYFKLLQVDQLIKENLVTGWGKLTLFPTLYPLSLYLAAFKYPVTD